MVSRNVRTVTIKTEGLRAGDVIPDWMDDGRKATVTSVRRTFGTSVMVFTDARPSTRVFKTGFDITVERAERAEKDK